MRLINSMRLITRVYGTVINVMSKNKSIIMVAISLYFIFILITLFVEGLVFGLSLSFLAYTL